MRFFGGWSTIHVLLVQLAHIRVQLIAASQRYLRNPDNPEQYSAITIGGILNMKSVSWQKWLLVAALALLVLTVTACAGRAQAAPPMQESPTAVPEEEAAQDAEAASEETAEEPVADAADEPETVLLYETYVSVMPAASGGGTRVLSLRLFEDGSATWDTLFHNDEPPIEELGTWEDNGDGTITVTITGREDRTYDEPNVVVFQSAEGQLTAVEYDESMFGSEGLQLRSVVDIASGLEVALFTIDLEAGFPLDPTFMSVNAGGAIPASLLGAECTGFVNNAPVVTVNWTGDADFLEAFFVSNDDPTMLVLTPDGQVLCNDDADDHLLDPVVEIPNPIDGTYRIWVGSYDSGNLLPGILVLTTKPEVNLGTFNLSSFIQRAQMPEVVPEPEGIADAEAMIETLDMALADSPDLADADLPTEVEVVADGIVPLFQLPLDSAACAGLVTGAPSYTFNWLGESQDVRIMFEGDGDASLLVIGPDRSIVCADDSADGSNLNPVVDISGSMTGLHAVYVGRIDPEAPVTGILTITDQSDEPEVLAPASE
jgi:hypothetical protein